MAVTSCRAKLLASYGSSSQTQRSASVDDLEFLFVEVDDVALERGLAEHPVHEPAGFLLVEVEGGVAVFPIEREVVFPQRLAGGVHQQRALVVEVDVVFDVVLLAELDPGVGLGFLHLHAGLVDGGDEAERDGERFVLRRAFVDLLDAVIPGGHFALLLPVGHFLLHVAEVGDHAHELGVGELASCRTRRRCSSRTRGCRRAASARVRAARRW